MCPNGSKEATRSSMCRPMLLKIHFEGFDLKNQAGACIGQREAIA